MGTVLSADSEVQKVLVVDDEADIRVLMKLVLEKHGFEVFEAADGQGAIEMLISNDGTIHYVVTDYLMPRMDGLQLCWELRKNPKFSSISKIFLITAHLSPDQFNDMGCFDAKFQKPIDFTKMLSILKET